MSKHKRLIEYSLVAIGLALFIGLGLRTVLAQNVTQGYSSDSTLQQGMIVELSPGDPTKVQPLPQSSETSMLGVVVAPNDTPVTISDTTQSQTYVATYGQYKVLVSNQNGVIKAGDAVTISAIDGVGMKADSGHQIIVGKAVENFDGSTNVQSTATLKTTTGTRNVSIGRIQVNINVAHNPVYHPASEVPGVPQFLSDATKIVTNKTVGAFRIYAGLVVLLVCAIIAGWVIYAGVRSGMTAIGRNPLAKSSILRNLLQVILAGIIIFIIGLIAVYLLLKI